MTSTRAFGRGITISKYTCVPTSPSRIDTTEKVTVRIVPRSRPKQMPVVMWGGIAGDLDRAKEIGFTHGLGISTDFGEYLGRRQTDCRPHGRATGKHPGEP